MPKVLWKEIVSNSVFRGGARRLRFYHLESPDDKHPLVALISVFVSYDRTVANGIRVGVLCDDFGNSEKVCGRDPCEHDSAIEKDGIPDDGLGRRGCRGHAWFLHRRERKRKNRPNNVDRGGAEKTMKENENKI